MRRKTLFSILAGLTLALVACARQQEPAQEPTDSQGLSAWCVYWDEGSAAAAAQKGNIQTLILFACIYREDGSIYIPPQLEKLHKSLSWRKDGVYLSFVNDVWREDGSSVQKSTQLLEKLLQSPESREQCAREMAELAQSWGCDGVEVDFENIDRSSGLWEPYLEFVETVWEAAKSRGLGCRVVLGSAFPTEQYVLPQGPEYSVMCYNLYGLHSGPGPKADLQFLRKVAKQFASVPGIRFALANGGFLWDSDGVIIRSLTTWEAELLAEAQQAQIHRDADSGAMVFTFYEGNDERIVWYTDSQTLELWREELSKTLEDAARTDLWRIE